MKKKSLLSMLFVAGLGLATTSTVVSCKDYDDDINGLNNRVDQLKSSLEDAKKDLQGQITTLKGQLEAADARLTAAVEKAQKSADDAQASADKAQATADQNAKDIIKLAGEVSSLEARIKTAEDAIKLINETLEKKVDKDVFNKTVEEINGKIKAVDDRLTLVKGELEDADAKIREDIKGIQEDLKQQKDALEKLTDRVKKLEDELPGLKDRLSTVETKVGTLETKVQSLEDWKKTVDSAIEKLQGDVKALEEKKLDKAEFEKWVADVYTKKVEEIEASIKTLTERVDALNVLIKKSLRSLVFVPKSYYWGVEAMPIELLDTIKYAMGGTVLKAQNQDATDLTKLTEDKDAYMLVETVGNVKNDAGSDAKEMSKEALAHHGAPYQDWTAGAKCSKPCRYEASKYERILDFWAEYELNPSGATIAVDDINRFSVVSSDKEFIHRAGAACGIDIYKATHADSKFKPHVGEGSYAGDVKGNLYVPMTVANSDAIKSVPKDDMITNFALQYQNNEEDDKNVITSDFATLYKSSVHFTLAHAKSGKDGNIPDYDVYNGHCRPCPNNVTGRYGAEGAHGHLMATIAEATGFENQTTVTLYKPQDSVAWNSKLDLNSLIEIHKAETNKANVVDKETAVYTPEALLKQYNISIKFELTQFISGKNETNESAHAALQTDENGITWLRPGDVTKPLADDAANEKGFGGKQQGFNAPQTRSKLVGRTPVVRVQLIDNETGSVLDYGYICVKIVDVDPEVDPDHAIVVPTRDYNWDAECSLPWGFKTQWSWDENYIYFEGANCTRDEFLDYYQDCPEVNTDAADLKQFVSKDGKTWVEAEYYYGFVSTIIDVDPSTGEKTSVIAWDIADATPDKSNAVKSDSLGEVKYETLNGKKRFNDASNIFYYIHTKKFTNQNKPKNNPNNKLQVAVRYAKNAGAPAKLPAYIYVVLETKGTSFARPMALLHWGQPDKNYWYELNGNTGYKFDKFSTSEFHVNVSSPEDVKDNAEPFDLRVAKAFIVDNYGDKNNKVLNGYWCEEPPVGAHNLFTEGHKAITWVAGHEDKTKTWDAATYSYKTGAKLYEKNASWINRSLVFDKKNIGKVYCGMPVDDASAKIWAKGADGKPVMAADKYIMSVSKDGKTLYANKGDKINETTREIVAVIDMPHVSSDPNYDYYICGAFGQCVNEQAVVYQHSAASEALLNYKAHNELANDVLTAYIGFKADICDGSMPIDIAYDDAPLAARFLRPLNPVSKNYVLVDAGTKLNAIALFDIMDFTDWREAWGMNSEIAANPSKVLPNSAYYFHYGIKNIEIVGVPDGGKLSNNKNVLCDLNNKGDLLSVAEVNDAFELRYHAGALAGWEDDYITYKNNTGTLNECKIFIPVTVTYYWGKVTKYVAVDIKSTLGGNGAPKK